MWVSSDLLIKNFRHKRNSLPLLTVFEYELKTRIKHIQFFVCAFFSLSLGFLLLLSLSPFFLVRFGRLLRLLLLVLLLLLLLRFVSSLIIFLVFVFNLSHFEKTVKQMCIRILLYQEPCETYKSYGNEQKCSKTTESLLLLKPHKSTANVGMCVHVE